jgi:hypothetical protein
MLILVLISGAFLLYVSGKIKKYHVLKKRRKKKSGDSFRDIVRIFFLSMMRVMYQAANITKAW